MSITPEENLEYLYEALALAKKGAPEIANAMAEYIVWRTREITLRQAIHAPGEYYRARPGAPPAYASGNLAEQMFYKSAKAGFRTTAIVGNKADYSRLLEFGCVITPKSGKYLGWRDSGRPDNPSGIWRHLYVDESEHPFLWPTVEDAINDGELLEVAIEKFKEYDP